MFEKTIEELLHFKRIATQKAGSELKRKKHLHHLEIVRKKSMYGMWVDPIVFIKVVLYDPGDITRLGSILQEGSLAGISMEVFECHIPYLLKFTSDFNVSPMSWIHIRQGKVRLYHPLWYCTA
jgi:DNA polymerase zeta